MRRELTDWLLAGRVVIFPFSIQCQHLDGCDCRRPDVVSPRLLSSFGSCSVAYEQAPTPLVLRLDCANFVM